MTPKKKKWKGAGKHLKKEKKEKKKLRRAIL